MGKAEIRKSIIQFVEENTRDFADAGVKTVGIDDIFLDGADEETARRFTFSFVSPPLPVKSYIHTLIDGCQLTKSLPFYDDKTLRWSTVSACMNRKIERYISLIQNIPSSAEQFPVLMFDDTRYSSRAKRPTQNQRRFDPIVRELRKYTADNKLKLPVPSTFEIRHGDLLPNTWRIFSLIPSVNSKFNNFIADGVDRAVCSVYEGGENVGEFDHYFLRYIIKTVRAERHSLSSLAQLVFNVVSSDTDILLYSLYILEFIQHSCKLDMAELPNITLVSPDETKRVHVTNLYRHLVAVLAPAETFLKETVVRSFCVAMIVSGNDNIPNTMGLVPHQYFLSFTLYRSMFGAPIVQHYGKMGMIRINGMAVTMLHVMAYASKYLAARNNVKLYESMRLDQVYAHVEKNAAKGKNKMISKETMLARISSLSLSVYALEHALLNVPDAERVNISQLTLPETAFYNYCQKLMTPSAAHMNNSVHFRLHEFHKCIGYTAAMYPWAKVPAETAMSEILDLIAERIEFGSCSRIIDLSDDLDDSPQIYY